MKTPEIAMIAAMDKNMAIGGMFGIPWHLPEDLKRFKQLTSHQTVLMGRKTYETIGKPLPNRKCLIMTRDPMWAARFPVTGDFCQTHVVSNAEAAIDLCESGTLWVIGGGEIYSLMMPMASRLELTELSVEACPREEMSAWFPNIPEDFKVTSRETHRGPDFFFNHAKFDYARYDR